MEQIVCYCREVVRKALWSLLVGVAAALPAVHGVRELPVAPTEAPARPSPVVEQAKKTEADTLVRAEVDHDDDPAPVVAFAAVHSLSQIPTAPRLQAAPPESPDLAPLARRSMRLPQPRAPDVRAAS